jgi:glycosyltransferase involved in cell wall biosynthesis
MRILVANHTGSVSGAEYVLLRLLEGLRAEHVVAVACPDQGPLAGALDQAGIARFSGPAFEASFRPHLVHTPAGVVPLVTGGVALARIARRFGADVLYANTPRAGLIGAVANQLGGPPLVVRIHDHFPSTVLGRSVRSVIARTAHEVVAISDYTAERFNDGLPLAVATRVYNSIDHSRFDPDHVAPARLREELGLAPDVVLLGQVAQITPWKGQDDAIRVLAQLRRDGLDAHLVIVGEITFAGKQVRYDNPAYLRALHRLVDELGVRHAVHFIGRREAVPAVFRALDVSLLPSWDEPFGLAAVESLAMGTPAFVTDHGGTAEVVQDGVAGRALPAKRPELWADALRQLLNDSAALGRMSDRGPKVAARFNDQAHVREMVAVFDRAAHSPRRRSGRARFASPSRGAPKGAQWPN